MRLPLGPNRNHQQTAFAGSLNALCTIAGWGTVLLLLKELERTAASSSAAARSATRSRSRPPKSSPAAIR